MESGSLLNEPYELFQSDELTKRTSDILRNSGCDQNKLEKNRFENCTQSLDALKILTETANYEKNIIFNGSSLASNSQPLFQLVLDGVEFKESIKESIQNQRYKTLNVLAGFIYDDGSFKLEPFFGTKIEPFANLTIAKQVLTEFYTYFPFYPVTPNESFFEDIMKIYFTNTTVTNYFKTVVFLISEQYFICPSIHLAELFSKTNSVFMYSYEQLTRHSSIPIDYGVMHGNELPFVFGLPIIDKTYTKDERALSIQMINYWTNFVKNGNPNGIGPSWPTISNKGSLLILNATSTRVGSTKVTSKGNKRNCDYWKIFENL